MDKPKIMIVDDDDEVRSQMRWALNEPYQVFQAEDRQSALQIMSSERPDVVTLDLGLPPSPGDTREGFMALSDLLQVDPFVKVLVITGQSQLENGVEAIGLGAYDFFSKPVKIDELKIIIERAIHVQRLDRERREMMEASGRLETFEGIIGSSPRIQSIFASVDKVATTEAPVLIIGESGTGKELVARAIHKRSARRSGPFIAINCGAIPENLIESELFGHEKGSFTGAHVQRQGRIELAQGGTLFLDEIADLPQALQVKLLRFLQEREIERVGGRSTIPVDARVLAATNADLSKTILEGKFREDLYYRLCVVVISMPPLRDREGDILLLAKEFLRRQSEVQQKTLVFTPKAIQAMQSHRWPGNVRELENRIQRAAIMAENGRIAPKDLEIRQYSEYAGHGLGKAREAMERQMIQAALARNKGNLTRAAAELEISRPSLYELIEKLGISRR